MFTRSSEASTMAVDSTVSLMHFSATQVLQKRLMA